jgi:hypothetical protein
MASAKTSNSVNGILCCPRRSRRGRSGTAYSASRLGSRRIAFVEGKAFARKAHFSCCLVLAACVGILAADVHAGDGGSPPFAERWRLFPRGPFARPADEEIAARFTRQIDSLAALFQPDESDVSLETAPDSLIDGKARIQLFRLESLLRLYARAFPDLEKYLREVKEVEDGLGAYSYAVDSLNFAKDKFTKENQTQAPDAARKAEQERLLEALAKREARARAIFAKLLERTTLGSDLPELRSAVRSSLVGWGPSRDLAYVNGELQRMLRNVRDGHLDFNLMEDGIHEFRRRLRWFPMQIDSLDGLILVRDDPPGACPVPSLEALAGSGAARHRYANPALRFPATHPCTISRCLLWQVSKTVRDIGHVKDEAQGNAAIESALADDDIDVATSNNVTPEESTRAKAIRTELFSSRALESLMAQLSTCKS